VGITFGGRYEIHSSSKLVFRINRTTGSAWMFAGEWIPIKEGKERQVSAQSLQMSQPNKTEASVPINSEVTAPTKKGRPITDPVLRQKLIRDGYDPDLSTYAE
jgi:hypothetical protein